GKFGQGKNGYALNQIRARLKKTSGSWVECIFFVMNLMHLEANHFLAHFSGGLLLWLKVHFLIQPIRVIYITSGSAIKLEISG
ncbi:MAG: hypothetical protein JXB49_13845, partial [Bacteroidales bacterium]|nr:hypothetical protein [Bacteroidales bacterium]